MYRREDQYRSLDAQLRYASTAQRRRVYRRRRTLAVLTVVAGLGIGLLVQTGVSFSSLLPQNEELARGGGGGQAEVTGLSGERTVLSVQRKSSDSAPKAPADTENDAEGKEAEKPPPASDEPLNVLILGVDRRPSEGESSSGRSDTMMLAQVTPGTGKVELLSVPRDLLVEIEPGVEDRINTAYVYGGVEQAKAVMEGLTGVPIDSHAIIDFEGFEEVIEAIGGVKVGVAPGEFPEKWHMGEGMQRLGGRKALFYARYRGTAGGDLDRIERQQKLLAALRSKMLAWNTVTKLPGMLKIANENVDTDLGILQAISLGRALATNGGKGDLKAVQLKGYPETLSSGAQVLVPDYEANEKILQEFRE